MIAFFALPYLCNEVGQRKVFMITGVCPTCPTCPTFYTHAGGKGGRIGRVGGDRDHI